MTLSEELNEASVAATGHHADLLRRAAEYVAACEGQANASTEPRLTTKPDGVWMSAGANCYAIPCD